MGWLDALQGLFRGPEPEPQGEVDPEGPTAPGGLSSDANFHVLPAPRAYRTSSTRGDFRLCPIPGGPQAAADGFVVVWRTSLSARRADGTPKWRLEGWGKGFALSPDGSRFAASNERGEVGLFDVRDARPLADPVPVAPYVWDLVWRRRVDEIVVNASDRLVVVAPGRGVVRKLEGFAGDNVVLTGLAELPNGRGLAVCHPNQQQLLLVDADTGLPLARATGFYASLAVVGGDRLYVAESETAVRVLDAETLRELVRWRVPGKLGVRHAGQAEFSWTQWKPVPRPSPDGRWVTINDKTGQLWLVDADGKYRVRYPREAVDQVEDTMWVDRRRFWALQNDGRIAKLDLMGRVLVAVKE